MQKKQFQIKPTNDMKKLILLLFIPLLSFSQEDIERYKVYDTENIYTSLLLDTATGKIWQLQIGIGKNSDRMRTVLSEEEFVNWEDKKNGRFKLYPTDNTYNFIMVDVIDGRTWQVQWNIDYDKRLVFRIW